MYYTFHIAIKENRCSKDLFGRRTVYQLAQASLLFIALMTDVRKKEKQYL